MKRLVRMAGLGLALALGVCSLSPTARAAAPAFSGPSAVLVSQPPQAQDNSEREFILDIINFMILLAALGYVLRKPAREFFAQRAASIREKLEEGSKALESAQAKLAEIEERLAGFDKEVAELKVSSESDSEDEHRRFRQATSEEVVKIQQLAQAQVAGAIRAAKTELRLFAAREAIEQARAMIGSRLDEKGHKRLVGFFLANLQSLKAKN